MKTDPMRLQTLVVGPLQVNCFIVSCTETKEALVIDPGDEGERILDAVASADLTLTTVVNTHGHFDHVGANRLLVERTGADLILHQADVGLLQRAASHAALYGLAAVPSPAPARFLDDGEVLQVGALKFEVIHLPGHSPGGICLLAPGHLFSGDALFAGSIGRTDLPGGDHDTLIRGIRSRLLVLPEATVVHSGHGPDTTIGREKMVNPCLG
jgi:hydroxyacylglutathione hydrolase